MSSAAGGQNAAGSFCRPGRRQRLRRPRTGNAAAGGPEAPRQPRSAPLAGKVAGRVAGAASAAATAAASAAAKAGAPP